jgi:hypothetical protein
MFALDKLSQWLGQSDTAAVRQRATATPKQNIRPSKSDVFLR